MRKIFIKVVWVMVVVFGGVQGMNAQSTNKIDLSYWTKSIEGPNAEGKSNETTTSGGKTYYKYGNIGQAFKDGHAAKDISLVLVNGEAIWEVDKSKNSNNTNSSSSTPNRSSSPSSSSNSNSYTTTPQPPHCYRSRCFWTETECDEERAHWYEGIRYNTITDAKDAKRKEEARIAVERERIAAERERIAEIARKEAERETARKAAIITKTQEECNYKPIPPIPNVTPMQIGVSSNSVSVSNNGRITDTKLEDYTLNSEEETIQNDLKNDLQQHLTSALKFSYGLALGGKDLVVNTWDLGYYTGTYYQTDFIDDLQYLKGITWGEISNFDIYKDFALSFYNPFAESLGNTLFNFLHGDAESRGKATFDILMTWNGTTNRAKQVSNWFPVDYSNPLQLSRGISNAQSLRLVPESKFGRLRNGFKTFSEKYDNASILIPPIDEKNEQD